MQQHLFHETEDYFYCPCGSNNETEGYIYCPCGSNHETEDYFYCPCGSNHETGGTIFIVHVAVIMKQGGLFLLSMWQ